MAYCSILGYNADDYNRCEGSGLLDCIMNVYYDFMPALIVTMFRLWNYIDFIFWLTFDRINIAVYITIANITFWPTKHIIEAYCNIDVCVSLLCMLFTPSILCLCSLSPLLHKFKYCQPNKTHCLSIK